MDMKTLRSKSVTALQRELDDATKRLHELRFQASSGQLKTVREIRATRQLISRINTVLAEQASEPSST